VIWIEVLAKAEAAISELAQARNNELAGGVDLYAIEASGMAEAAAIHASTEKVVVPGCKLVTARTLASQCHTFGA
jgi:hypothetical protein